MVQMTQNKTEFWNKIMESLIDFLCVVNITFANTLALNLVPGWRFSILNTGRKPLSSLFTVSCLRAPACPATSYWQKFYNIILSKLFLIIFFQIIVCNHEINPTDNTDTVQYRLTTSKKIFSISSSNIKNSCDLSSLSHI